MDIFSFVPRDFLKDFGSEGILTLVLFLVYKDLKMLIRHVMNRQESIESRSNNREEEAQARESQYRERENVYMKIIDDCKTLAVLQAVQDSEFRKLHEEHSDISQNIVQNMITKNAKEAS